METSRSSELSDRKGRIYYLQVFKDRSFKLYLKDDLDKNIYSNFITKTFEIPSDIREFVNLEVERHFNNLNSGKAS